MELCTVCHGGCCRRYNPDITGIDIINICETLKLDINFFINAIPLEEEKVNELKGKVPLFIFTDSGEEVYYRLALKSNESRFYPGTSKCIFLQEWHAELMGSEKLTGVIGRCGIYSCRPINCRAYPAVYENGEITIRDPHLILEKEQKMIEDSSAYRLCPQALTEEDYKPFMDSYTHNAVLNKYEKEFFIKLSEKWNKKPDLSDNLYDFLVKEYGGRIEHIK